MNPISDYTQRCLDHFSTFSTDDQKLYVAKLLQKRADRHEYFGRQISELSKKVFEYEAENLHLRAVLSIYESKQKE